MCPECRQERLYSGHFVRERRRGFFGFAQGQSAPPFVHPQSLARPWPLVRVLPYEVLATMAWERVYWGAL